MRKRLFFLKQKPKVNNEKLNGLVPRMTSCVPLESITRNFKNYYNSVRKTILI